MKRFSYKWAQSKYIKQ